ncbi:unnamed protein product [Rhizophagus irregularis]|nr:unnamed protein product [Rhizophagus irregularis]CAB4443787.1 unnamed protein product [Rhizophagus irregularis]
MGRPSRLSSDSDLLNVRNPASCIGFDPSLWIGIEHLVTPPLDAKLSGCGQIDVERLMFSDDFDMMMKLPSDDDSEDNSMVKSYQKNLDCIFQGKFYGMNVPYSDHLTLK